MRKAGFKHSKETIKKMRKAKLMENNPNWRGGRRWHKQGYVLLKKPGHPNADKRGYILEHRFVVAEALGRSLKPEEVVHHINNDCADNRPGNLMVFDSNEAHKKFEKGTEIDPWSIIWDGRDPVLYETINCFKGKAHG